MTIAKAGQAAEFILVRKIEVTRFTDVTMLTLRVCLTFTLARVCVTGCRVVPGSCFVTAAGSFTHKEKRKGKKR